MGSHHRLKRETQGYCSTMKVIASLLVTVTAFLRNTEVVHADKVNSTLPFNYYHCFDGTCNHGNDIAVDAGCQDMRWFSMTDKGADFKKLGSGIKVTYYMRNRCEQYQWLLTRPRGWGVWGMQAKLWRARSRLYRSRFF